MEENKIPVPNDIKVVISNEKNGELLNENCCTCINIMLTNEGKIATSFLGTHNPFIVTSLERAQRAYFKELKKSLVKDFKEYATDPTFLNEDNSNIEFINEEKPCDCEDNCNCDSNNSCSCNHQEEHCNCKEEHCDCNSDNNTCDCDDTCTCGCKNTKK